MPNRVVSKQVEAEYQIWNPSDPQPFARLAGSQFVDSVEEKACYKDQSGREMTAYPGWVVLLPAGNGDGEAYFLTPQAFEAFWETPGMFPQQQE